MILHEAKEIVQGQSVNVKDPGQRLKSDVGFPAFHPPILYFRQVVALRERLDSWVAFLYPEFGKTGTDLGQQAPESFI